VKRDSVLSWASVRRAGQPLRALIAPLAVALGWGCAAALPAATADTTAITKCPGAHTRIAFASLAELRGAVVCLVDRERTTFGLPPLRESESLDRAAQGWTDVMVSYDDFSHGSNFGARLTAAGFAWSTAGENIATGYRTPAALVRAWTASAAHCQNLLDPQFRYVGIGVLDRAIGDARRGGTWTQDFGLGLRQRPPSDDWAPAEGCPYR